MKNLEYDIRNWNLVRTPGNDTTLISGAVDYFGLVFHFDEESNRIHGPRRVEFLKNRNKYRVDLVENACAIPNELLYDSGKFLMRVTIDILVATTWISVGIRDSGIILPDEPSEQIPGTEYVKTPTGDDQVPYLRVREGNLEFSQNGSDYTTVTSGDKGTMNYEDLGNKPEINGVTLDGSLTTRDLGINDFSGKYEDLMGAPEVLPNPNPITFSGLITSASYDGRTSVNVAFPDASVMNEIGGPPVGEVIAYMGLKAPLNYLICDGTEYAISDYPELAQHFLEQFEAVNAFGGDGDTTFAVPDLRGEFLRGSGTGARNTGTGAKVGLHQQATSIPCINSAISGSSFYVGYESNRPALVSNADTILRANSPYKSQTISAMLTDTPDNRTITVTSRPTNTAVLYCIKCRSTRSLNLQHRYSFDEQVVGTWVDGKPLYEKTYNCGRLSGANVILKIPINVENIDRFTNIFGIANNPDGDTTSFPIIFANTLALENTVTVFTDDKSNICIRSGVDRTAYDAYITLRYTKTTD